MFALGYLGKKKQKVCRLVAYADLCFDQYRDSRKALSRILFRLHRAAGDEIQ
jgi:hypothetical protein